MDSPVCESISNRAYFAPASIVALKTKPVAHPLAEDSSEAGELRRQPGGLFLAA